MTRHTHHMFNDAAARLAAEEETMTTRDKMLQGFREIAAAKAQTETLYDRDGFPSQVSTGHQAESPSNQTRSPSSEVAYGHPGSSPRVPLGPSPYMKYQQMQASPSVTFDLSGPDSPAQAAFRRQAAMRGELASMNQAAAASRGNLPHGQGPAGVMSRPEGISSTHPHVAPSEQPARTPGRARGFTGLMPKG